MPEHGVTTTEDTTTCERSPLGTFAECPHCAGQLFPEHAHFRCRSCGWRDSCCD
ncbi:MAG TPA: hypothetical protein VHV57_12455 [Acidimicrobiales bacterium]|nr:hypothetical protein [Acidimicrobiales bacterium]